MNKYSYFIFVLLYSHDAFKKGIKHMYNSSQVFDSRRHFSNWLHQGKIYLVGYEFATIAEAKLAVFEYIEGWYNRKRKHSALGSDAMPVRKPVSARNNSCQKFLQ